MFRVLLLLIASLLVGHVYGMSVEGEKIELEKCKAAGDSLKVNQAFVGAAVSWRYDRLPAQRYASRQEQIASINRVSQTPFEAMRGDGSLDGKILTEWFKSPYCQSLLRSFQDFVVASYSRSLVDKSTREVSCDAFSQQYRFTYMSDAPSYRNPLLAGLRATLNDSLYKLNNVQRSHVLSRISGDGLRSFGREVDGQCSEGSLLSDSLVDMPSLFVVESARSSEIKKEIDAPKNLGCGTLKELYCLDDIRRAAYNDAYEMSVQCDRQDGRAGDCSLNSRQLMEAYFYRAEVKKLKDEIGRHQRYVNDPISSGDFGSANASGNIYQIAEDCKQDAIAKGLHNEAFRKYSEEVCTPQARAKYVAPQAAALKKLKARLSDLERQAVPGVSVRASAGESHSAKKGSTADSHAGQSVSGRERFAVADVELNKVYRALMSSLRPEQKVALKQEQIQWIKKKERDCGGDVQCLSDMTEARVSYLKSYSL